MKKYEKLEYLKTNYYGVFLTTHYQAFNDLSDQQTMFCCCGRLATGLHERHCRKFNDKVNSEVIRRLKHLLQKRVTIKPTKYDK